MQRTNPKPDISQKPGCSADLDEITQQPVSPRILHLAQKLQKMIDEQTTEVETLN
ncbi:MAG: hypothetical protein H7245_01205 [Candidatus Saccharibacteria bacterium]|nr:hypothetical protein [Pseudorhodobacter sp.]